MTAEQIKLCFACDRSFSTEVVACPHDGMQLISLLPGNPKVQEPDLTGHKIAPYRIGERVASDSTSITYRALNPIFNQEVRFTVLRAAQLSPESLKQFKQQAHDYATHPSLGKNILDLGVIASHGLPYMILAHVIQDSKAQEP